MASSGEQVTDNKTPSLKRSSKHMQSSVKRVESSDVSLDASIVEIHKKIRKVNILKGLPS
jgi:exonuclease VII small subunit